MSYFSLSREASIALSPYRSEAMLSFTLNRLKDELPYSIAVSDPGHSRAETPVQAPCHLLPYSISPSVVRSFPSKGPGHSEAIREIEHPRTTPTSLGARAMPFIDSNPSSPSGATKDGVSFEKLVQDLSAALGSSSGLDSDDVDPVDIQKLMDGYVSNEAEWGPYALGDISRTYTRNLIDEGNGKSNLVSLTAVVRR